MDVDAPESTWLSLPPRRPAVTLTFDLWPTKSNQVTHQYRLVLIPCKVCYKSHDDDDDDDDDGDDMLPNSVL